METAILSSDVKAAAAAEDSVSIPMSPSGKMDADEDVAIRLSNAYKHYGSGKKRLPVLIGLDMEVKRGQIYGLLGPSGCGKTTLLKCIVGKLKVDSGSVLVFGEPPGSRVTGVPGARVGYMPQELALFGEFNIEETLTYFRRVFGMSQAKYEERLNFLMKFLDLPSRTRALQQMSGGQQRRASLAVALLHEPELLILDEPTVGVDPLLRTSIWEHLVEMTSSGRSSSSNVSSSSSGGPPNRCTIVITTHYIEEARQAHRVGMMRFGKLLAEGAPDTLLDRYMKPTLEDVFLELCLQDGVMETADVREERAKRTPIVKKLKLKKHKKTTANNSNYDDDVEDASEQQKLNNGDCRNGTINSNGTTKLHKEMAGSKADSKKSSQLCKSKSKSRSMSRYLEKQRAAVSFQKVNACMLKTFNRMKKRIGFLIYQFLLPALQVSLFCLAIGQDPKKLPVAVVNSENNGLPCDNFSMECPIDQSFIGLPERNEHLANFTCRYLSFLNEKVAKPVFYPDPETALTAVEHGEAWGMIYMGHNFTESVYERILEFLSSDDFRSVDIDLLDRSSIKVRMDITNQHIAFTLQMEFVKAFQGFMEQLITSCDMPKEVASIPLVFEEPVYGTEDLTFTDFMAPGIILTIVHSMALGYSAMIIIMERNEGLLDRTWVAGVTPSEFALAHFLVSLVVNLLQVIVTLLFMILVFQVPNEGSLFLVFLLTMLQGVCGTTIGLIISAVCETQQDATQIALGIFYPNLILSGIIWPVESMPTILRYIAYVLPQTFACEAMRGILLRGWGLAYMPVWRGFAVTLAWILATYIIFKRLVSRQG